jgi:hypothetical protein
LAALVGTADVFIMSLTSTEKAGKLVKIRGIRGKKAASSTLAELADATGVFVMSSPNTLYAN